MGTAAEEVFDDGPQDQQGQEAVRRLAEQAAGADVGGAELDAQGLPHFGLEHQIGRAHV